MPEEDISSNKSDDSSNHPMHFQLRTRKWFIAVGVVLLVIGTAAIILPVLGTIGATLLIAWLLIFSGIIQIAHIVATKHEQHKLSQLIINILSIIAGFLLLLEPIQGAYAVTLVLAFYFLFIGILRISIGSKTKTHRTGWIIASGIIDIILAALILLLWPSDSLWIPGVIVGIDLLFAGWSLIMLSSIPFSIITDLTNTKLRPR